MAAMKKYEVKFRVGSNVRSEIVEINGNYSDAKKLAEQRYGRDKVVNVSEKR